MDLQVQAEVFVELARYEIWLQGMLLSRWDSECAQIPHYAATVVKLADVSSRCQIQVSRGARQRTRLARIRKGMTPGRRGAFRKCLEQAMPITGKILTKRKTMPGDALTERFKELAAAHRKDWKRMSETAQPRRDRTPVNSGYALLNSLVRE